MSFKTRNLLLKIKSRELIDGRKTRGFLFYVYRLITGVMCGWISFAASKHIENVVFGVAVISASSVLYFLMISLLKTGEEAWHCCLSNKREPSVRHVLFWLAPYNLLKSSLLMFVLKIRRALWIITFSAPGCVLIICSSVLAKGTVFGRIMLTGGIVSLISGLFFAFVINQRYFLAKYLLAKYPQMTTKEIIKKSVLAMNGNCMRTVMFKISFLPQLVIFHTFPYIKQACTGLKREIIELSCEQK